jgi:universal stress protein A
MRISTRNILWPTDFSKHSLKALQYARAFCEAFGARLHVINVAPIVVFTGPQVPIMTGGDKLCTEIDTVTPQKTALRELLVKQFGDIGKIKSTVTLGNAWYEICRYAQDNDIDLIVIGTHGLTGLKHLVMGSTAERVVQHAKCPVLTVKVFERDFLQQIAPQRTRASVTSSRRNLRPRRLVRV